MDGTCRPRAHMHRPVDVRRECACARTLLLLLLQLLLLPDSAWARDDVKIEILSPTQGAVLTGGVLHLNYTVSRCPLDTSVMVYLDDDTNGMFFWCKRDPVEAARRGLPADAAFMWHGITLVGQSGLSPGSHTITVVLNQGNVPIAHAGVYFEVVGGHGRFFGVNSTTFVDGHGTGAYFLSPLNRSIVIWDPDGIELELLSLNFIPGLNGYHFHVSINNTPGEVVESASASVRVRLDPGTHCLSVRAFNAELKTTVGDADSLCVRVVRPEQVAMSGGPPADCNAMKETLRGAAVRWGLVIDTPSCEHSGALLEACPSCELVLCVPQLGDGPIEEAQAPAFSRAHYRAHSRARLRIVSMQEVPALEAQSLDFLFVRQLRIDSAVDQQAELESRLGLMWALVREGGYFGFLHEPQQIIIVLDADGNLWEQVSVSGLRFRA